MSTKLNTHSGGADISARRTSTQSLHMLPIHLLSERPDVTTADLLALSPGPIIACDCYVQGAESWQEADWGSMKFRAPPMGVFPAKGLALAKGGMVWIAWYHL